MAIFALDPKLEADTVEIMRYDLCRVLMMKDANYPWVILVPARANMIEIHELDEDDQRQLMREITATSKRLKAGFEATKINVGALGNIVSQLHVHIIARFDGDPAWPDPVWGKFAPSPYPEGDLDVWVEGLRKLLA